MSVAYLDKSTKMIEEIKIFADVDLNIIHKNLPET